MKARCPVAAACLLAATAHAQFPLPQRVRQVAGRAWLSGQINIVNQTHRRFRSPYEGPNSFRSGTSSRTSEVVSLYTGLRLSENTSLLATFEQTGGTNLSRSVGLAGHPNLDYVGVPNARPYLARALLHHSLRLGAKTIEVSRGPLQLAANAAEPQLDIYAGKFSIPDFFDVNSVGGDPHYQFLNWSINNNATYGYSADTRGYTYGVMIEYRRRGWAARFAEVMQAKPDDPASIDFRVGQFHAEHFEVEIPVRAVHKRVGLVRALAFAGRADLGLYREAVASYLAGAGRAPDLAATRGRRSNFGFGLNAEQELTDDLRIYGRLGWNDGKTEERNNTEANRAISGGLDLAGKRWGRLDDKFGVAAARSGLSRDHRQFLALGGTGAILGDGALKYGPETLVEFYYTTRVAPGVYVSADYQRIARAGYNRDRGPINVATVRLHLESWFLKEPR